MKNKQIKWYFISMVVVVFSVACTKTSKVEKNPVLQKLMKVKEVDYSKHPDVKTFITTNRDSSDIWFWNEVENGRSVRSYIDKKTGEYVCQSIPKEAVPLPKDEEILNLLDENLEFTLDDKE